MEQWVTDTFYSYFPGFNNENQKRQNYLRERQRENQQNFLKHQVRFRYMYIAHSPINPGVNFFYGNLCEIYDLRPKS